MNDREMTPPVAEKASPKDAALRRRTIIGAAAWAAPVIVTTVASPAYAASQSSLSLTAPAAAEVGVLAQDAVYATVLVGGVPAEGVTVEFSVHDTSLAGWGGEGTITAVAVTNAAGIAYPPSMLLKEAGTVQLAATANDRTDMASIIVTAVPLTGTMAFKQSTVNVAAGSTFALAGSLTRTSGTGYPAEVALAYPAGFSGPAAVLVDQATGEFLVPGVVAGTVGGTITASTSGFGAASVAISLVLGYISTLQAVYSAGKGLKSPHGTYLIKGAVNRVAPGATFPATVTLNWSNTEDSYQNVTGFSNGRTVPVNQTTGAFTLPTLTPIDAGTDDKEGHFLGGRIAISAADYRPMEITLYNRPTSAVVDWLGNSSTTPAAIAFAAGEVRDVTGVSLVQSVMQHVSYPEGFTGPGTVAVSASGAYILRGVKAPDYITNGEFRILDDDMIGYTSRGVFFVL